MRVTRDRAQPAFRLGSSLLLREGLKAYFTGQVSWLLASLANASPSHSTKNSGLSSLAGDNECVAFSSLRQETYPSLEKANEA